MPLTDEEKLRLVQDMFCKEIRSYNTWQNFKNMLINLTKMKVKNAIKNALQAGANEKRSFSQNYLTCASDLEDLGNEIDEI